MSIPEWVKYDLAWWSYLLSVFNGASKVIQEGLRSAVVETDSSFSRFAAVYNDHDWLAGSWNELDIGLVDYHSIPTSSEFSSHMDINLRELWPVIAAAQRWGHAWRDCKIRLRTDNTQVQSMIKTGRSSSSRCMWWLRRPTIQVGWQTQPRPSHQ